ncbi:MAG TPA: hypothetical protein VHM90_03220 [Phycisphaerae bacterium]|jgi:hypothetical protein|nr:hypothetical protein [Phycisphaerae bacterium]
METLSHKFLMALAVPRDGLYRRALAKATTPSAAESALQDSARAVFREYAGEKVQDVAGAMEKSIGEPVEQAAATSTTTGDAPAMPADVWARLSAAVEVEAALSSHSSALNPDSVLLRPDPMLAPKKARPREAEEFDVSSPSRLLVLLGAVLLVGILVTIYIVTRPAAHAPATAPATGPGKP